jgi:hypothetical protein
VFSDFASSFETPPASSFAKASEDTSSEKAGVSWTVVSNRLIAAKDHRAEKPQPFGSAQDFGELSRAVEAEAKKNNRE